jgi:hypothetical protein
MSVPADGSGVRAPVRRLRCGGEPWLHIRTADVDEANRCSLRVEGGTPEIARGDCEAEQYRELKSEAAATHVPSIAWGSDGALWDGGRVDHVPVLAGSLGRVEGVVGPA